MEVKKSKNAEIESRRGTWFLMGFVVVLAFMFVAFEWSRTDVKIDTSNLVRDITFEQTLVPVTFPEPPAPPPPAPIVPDIIDVVPDTDESVPEVDLGSTENTGEGVEIGDYLIPDVDIPEVIEDEIVDFAEIMPEYPGGTAALMKYLASSIKYPTISQEIGSQGKVIVQFVVDKDGSISNPIVLKGVDPHIDKEALRVVMSMKKWNPGRQRGAPVRVKYTLPVHFQLK